jgi:hypothetical protein
MQTPTSPTEVVMKGRLRLLALASYVVAAGAAFLLSPSQATASTAAACGQCYATSSECVANQISCGGGTASHCVQDHWCCGRGGWYNYCD